jgi:hypothetical protein
VLHDDVNLEILLVDNSVVIPHNVGVSQLPKDVDFGNDLLLLFLIHFSVVQLLPHKELAVGLPLDFAHKTKTAYPSLATKFAYLCRYLQAFRTVRPSLAVSCSYKLI